MTTRPKAKAKLKPKQFVFPTRRLKRYRFPTHINDLVVDRAEAAAAEVFVVVLGPGKAPPLHKHDDTEQIFYILSGSGVLRIGKEQQEHRVRTGDVVRIPPKTWHSIRGQGKKSLRYLAVDCFPGGRPKAEPTWEAHVKVLCKEQGWKFNF